MATKALLERVKSVDAGPAWDAGTALVKALKISAPLPIAQLRLATFCSAPPDEVRRVLWTCAEGSYALALVTGKPAILVALIIAARFGHRVDVKGEMSLSELQQHPASVLYLGASPIAVGAPNVPPTLYVLPGFHRDPIRRYAKATPPDSLLAQVAIASALAQARQELETYAAVLAGEIEARSCAHQNEVRKSLNEHIAELQDSKHQTSKLFSELKTLAESREFILAMECMARFSEKTRGNL